MSNLVLLHNFDVTLPLVISYVLVFFRPQTYGIDSLSMMSAYFSARRNPSNTFVFLHRCALYWNELTYFPLPFLSRILLISAEQDVKRTLQEVDFIVAERPRQINTARMVTIEIVLLHLEQVTHLEGIALVSGWLDKNLPESMKASALRSSEVQFFALLRDISKEAARVQGFLRMQSRIGALETMIALLNKTHEDKALKSRELNRQLRSIVQQWLSVAERKLEELESTLDKIGQIPNVYQPGTELRSQDSFFVGRGDIARQIDESLKEVKYRSTFLLYGERRMGKSSLLLQLTSILGSSFLPVFYNLGSPIMTSDTYTFLRELSTGIYRETRQLRKNIKELHSSSLVDASKRNDSAVYKLFDNWLDDIEEILEEEDRTILICFDEYDKLEEAGRLGHLNIGILLDWLRSTIQSRSHIAFLFCGVRTFDELGMDWVDHFGYVRSVKVSFLQAAEARVLIARPVSGFPNEIFSKEVIEEILRVTGCHPFLIQATCSALVDYLNEKGRIQAELQDIPSIIYSIVELWSAYFQDLWNRSDQQQQMCLQLLTFLNTESLQELAQYSGIDEKLVRNALQLLQKRDLVFLDKNVYRIAVPIWNEWLHQNTLNTDTWEQLHDSILKTALVLHEGTIRQILFSQGTITASAFPYLSPTLVYELLKTYMENHSNINVEFQESTQELRLRPQVVGPVQKIYTQLESLMQITRSNPVNEEFEPEVQKLFQIFSSFVDVSSVYQHTSKDFAIFCLHTQHVFENMHVPIPTPVLVSPYSDISEKSIDHIRHVFKDLGSGVRIAILLLFCDSDKLRQAQQVLTDKLRKVFAIDVVVMNQDSFLNILCAKEPVQMLRHLVLSQVSLTAVDPYIITGPTPVDFFFGREAQLRKIADHITTTSYAIIGGRRIGKTSTVSCLHRSRLPACGFRTIYQDCSNISTYESFINNKIRNWQPEPPVNAPTTFGELFEAPPDDSPLVLLLDEADKLVPGDRENGWRIFNTLRALINAKRIQVVLSGERTLQEALRDSHSPLFNLADPMLLGPLDFQAVSELVIRPMKQLEIKIVDETAIVRHIYDFTSGHPNVVQRLCRRLIDQLNAQESRCITLLDVAAVTDDPKFQEDDFLKTYWDAATSLERIITLALSHQAGIHRFEEIHRLVCEQASIKPGMRETKEALDRLVDLRSLLKQSQAGYAFSIEAFPRILLNTTTRADLLLDLTEEYKKSEQKE